jgi:hypothetical protein
LRLPLFDIDLAADEELVLFGDYDPKFRADAQAENPSDENS